MKTVIRHILIALAVALSICSCEKFGMREGMPCEVVVSLDSRTTKSSTFTDENEQAIISIQALVFREDGTLDGYNFIDNPAIKQITVNCTTGDRKFYIVCNAPSLATVGNKTAFDNAISYMSDSRSDALMLVGTDDKTLTGDATFTMTVNHVCSRVVLKKVTADFASLAGDFRILDIYMTNVAGDYPYALAASGPVSVTLPGATDPVSSPAAYTPTVWYNQKGYASSTQDRFLFDNVNLDLTNHTPHTFTSPYRYYPYPNSTTEDKSEGTTWTPRYTRLVIKASIGGEICYYPISINLPVSNYSYELENLVITKGGMPKEDYPVDFKYIIFVPKIGEFGTEDDPVTFKPLKSLIVFGDDGIDPFKYIPGTALDYNYIEVYSKILFGGAGVSEVIGYNITADADVEFLYDTLNIIFGGSSLLPFGTEDVDQSFNYTPAP